MQPVDVFSGLRPGQQPAMFSFEHRLFTQRSAEDDCEITSHLASAIRSSNVSSVASAQLKHVVYHTTLAAAEVSAELNGFSIVYG